MEGQTELPANPKRKEKGKKRKIRTLPTTACIGVEIKEKERKRREKRTLREEEVGNAAAHSSPEKTTASENSKQVKEEFLRKNKDISAKIRK